MAGAAAAAPDGTPAKKAKHASPAPAAEATADGRLPLRPRLAPPPGAAAVVAGGQTPLAPPNAPGRALMLIQLPPGWDCTRELALGAAATGADALPGELARGADADGLPVALLADDASTVAGMIAWPGGGAPCARVAARATLVRLGPPPPAAPRRRSRDKSKEKRSSSSKKKGKRGKKEERRAETARGAAGRLAPG